MWASPKIGKSLQIWKSLEMWKWRNIWCVGGVLIGIFIYVDMYEETLRASAGPLLRRFWGAQTTEVSVRIGARPSRDK